MLCPNILKYGACDVKNCRHTHPDFVCDICGIVCRSQRNFDFHLRGPQHAATKRAISRNPELGPKKCTICNADFPAGSVSTHVNGRNHQGRLLALRQAGTPIPPNNGIISAEDRNFECSICEIQVWETRKAHEAGRRHQRMEKFLAIRAALEEAERDKNGVSIEPSGRDAFDFGLNKTGQDSREIKIRLDDRALKIKLSSATLSGAKRGSW